MFLEYVDSDLQRIESEISKSSSRDELFQKLRYLGLDDFGLLMTSMPNSAYPRISELLPRMASNKVQQDWTGNSGVSLLKQTCDFVRSVSYHYCKYVGRPLDNATILDFGCGYGRIARLMYYFSGTENVVGVDPWDQSIDICHGDGLTQNFFLSDYLPRNLPIGDKRFDLIYAFSVFTHLSERATRMSMETLLEHLKPNGLLVITIRPVEYWNHDIYAQKTGKMKHLIAAHRERGFSFLPHNRPPIDGDVTYGDTSMSLDWIREAFPMAEILGTDRSLDDPYQTYVFLRNANAAMD